MSMIVANVLAGYHRHVNILLILT